MIAALRIRAALWGAGFAALFRLVALGVPAAFRPGGLAALLGASSSQRLVFAALRAFKPNLRLKRRFITAYDSTGTVLITRHADVTEVLEREADFAVVYEPRMRAITGGENFFLGMQDSADYVRDVSMMRLVVRREDVATRLIPFVAAQAAAIVAASGGRLDVPAQLTGPIAARILAEYFGTPGPSEAEMIRWTTRMFWYLFADLDADPVVGRAALADAQACRAWLDGAIAARRAAPVAGDDVLNRCLAMPGLGDLAIRNNLLGLMIGLVPTLSKAAVLALNQLFEQPAALAMAQEAARHGDDALLGACLFEALRFDPVNPILYRRAVREVVIARGHLRALRVPEGSMVLAANLSAMFDPFALESPGEFRTDRPWGDTMLWGYGMHHCFGAQINRAVIPQMLKPLLQREGLRRLGPVDGAGSPFPAHFPVGFD
ncbi:MAG: cytochrome P450 [Roseococcus sp.]|nr:cytochrome P450 [Roseococcus sp.]